MEGSSKDNAASHHYLFRYINNLTKFYEKDRISYWIINKSINNVHLRTSEFNIHLYTHLRKTFQYIWNKPIE